MSKLIPNIITLLRRGQFAVGRSERVDGLWVGVSDRKDRVLLPRVLRALASIKAHDPLRYTRLLKDVRRVWIDSRPGYHGLFITGEATLELDSWTVRNKKIPLIALVLVHEATHARIWRRGIVRSADRIEREERVCQGREQAFARRHPQAEALLRCIVQKEEDLPFYRDTQGMADYLLASQVTELRTLGVPEWLVTLITKRHASRRSAETEAIMKTYV